MKYHNAKLRQLLAAEYVLGTLRGLARRRFEKQARRDILLTAEIAFWEMRFGEFGMQLAPVAPPSAVWLGLQHRINVDSAKVTPLRRPLPPPVAAAAAKPAPLWRIGAGLATAAGVVVAVLIGQRIPLPEPAVIATTAPAPAAKPAPQALPTYVALLKIPNASLQWTLSLAPERGRLTAVASGEYPKLGAHSLELWLITAQGPVSLGLLPLNGSGALTLPASLVNGEAPTLAISLEPTGGSPTGKPTGPVLTSAAAVKAA